MFQNLFNTLTGEQKTDTVEKVISHASPRPSFFLMIMLAVAMAAMGVITDSVVVLIGSVSSRATRACSAARSIRS
jgi:hypothetical protein